MKQNQIPKKSINELYSWCADSIALLTGQPINQTSFQYKQLYVDDTFGFADKINEEIKREDQQINTIVNNNTTETTDLEIPDQAELKKIFKQKMTNNVKLWSSAEDDWLRELWSNVFLIKIIQQNLSKTKVCEEISKRFEKRDYFRSPQAISRRLVFLSMSIGFCVCMLFVKIVQNKNTECTVSLNMNNSD